MINDNDLPADLQAIQRDLGAAKRQPPHALRQRVLAGVQDELKRSARQEFWQYAAAVAACAILLLNVAISAGSRSPALSRAPDRQQLATLRAQLEQMQLDLPPEELNRQCLLLAASGQLLPSCIPQGSLPGTTAALGQSGELP